MEFHKKNGSWVKAPKRKSQTIEPEIPHQEPDHHSPPHSPMAFPDVPSSSAGPSTSMPPPPPVSGSLSLSDEQMHTLASVICQQMREEMRSIVSAELVPIRTSHEALLQELKEIKAQVEATASELVHVGTIQTIRSIELQEKLKIISDGPQELTSPGGNVGTVAAQLRGKIERASLEFEALVAAFHQSQGDQFRTLLDSINAFIEAAARAIEQRRR